MVTVSTANVFKLAGQMRSYLIGWWELDGLLLFSVDSVPDLFT